MHATVQWVGAQAGHLELLDQTLLPHEERVLTITTLAPLIDAILRLAVRGAPAIGVAAGYGMVLGMRDAGCADGAAFASALPKVAATLIAARPTAVNLPWAVARLQARGRREPTLAALLAEARAIQVEDADLCRRIGQAGAGLVRDGMTVLTHCNAGRLATAGDGTALALLYEAQRRGTRFRVLADETRPLLQGARLTAYELTAAGIEVAVIPDAAAAGLIARGEVQLVLVGADRIARNGDFANKVGTYGVALAARAHGIGCYVAAPFSTIDVSTPDGASIPIEERSKDEVWSVAGQRIAALGAGARNPAFDVTPASLVTGLVTERGVLAPLGPDAIKAALA